MTNPDESFVNLANSRLPEQRKVLEVIQQSGQCPFCPENLIKYHARPIIKEGRHWLLTQNQWPYPNTKLHFLVIHRQHAEKLSDLAPGAWTELGEIVTWVETSSQIRGGGLGLRFGDPALNGGTVRHLHVQLLVAAVTDKSDPRYQPVRLKVG